MSPGVTDTVAIVGAASGIVGLIVATGAQLRLTRMRRAYARLVGDATQEDLAAIVGQHVGAVEGLGSRVQALAGSVATLREDLAVALRHVAVVRYDAFGDMGGRLSFSAAMLDDAGDGIVLSAINGRTETRSYAKGVRSGGSDFELSPEERDAIAHAMKHAGLTPPARSAEVRPGATAAPTDDEPEIVIVEAAKARAARSR